MRVQYISFELLYDAVYKSLSRGSTCYSEHRAIGFRNVVDSI